MKLTYIALAALALLGSANHVSAADKTFGNGTLPDFLKPFDVDGDGKLSIEERQAAKAALDAKKKEKHEDFITKWDTNGDGKLDDTEKAAARDAMRAKLIELRTKRFNDADKDSNGQLTKVEFSAIVPADHLPAGALDLIFAHLDADASGGISLAEFLAGCAPEGPRPPAPPVPPTTGA